MLKRYGGFKANTKIPPLLIPAIPCEKKSHNLCNGFFVPSMEFQKSCLHCLNYKIKNSFPINIKREEVILNIKITWVDNKTVQEILDNNKEQYSKFINVIYKF